MIGNIIDNRTRPYRWKAIYAIVEATHHDNSCRDADWADPNEFRDNTLYEDRVGLSVEAAIAWAATFPDRVTLYLRDVEDASKS